MQRYSTKTIRRLGAACIALATAGITCGPAATPGAGQPTEPRPTPTVRARTAPPPGSRRPRANGPRRRVVKTTLAAVGLDPTAFDRSVSPCKDFYRFACGKWIDRTPIPPDRPRWNRSFSEIYKRNEAALRKILEGAAASKATSPLLRKVGGYYRACMDVKRVERAGLAPVRPLLRLARRVRNAKTLQRAIVALHQHAIWVFFGLGSTQDFHDATKVIAEIDQAGLGLPDRDYYLKQDKRSKEIRAFYVKHVARMLRLAGASAARARRGAAQVMAIETALAKVSKTRVERRNPKKVYHRLNRAGVLKAAPHLAWLRYFKAMGRPDLEAINVTAPKFLRGVDGLLRKTPARKLRPYLEWHILQSMAGALPKRFVQEAFKMAQRLTGQKVMRARWKRCVSSTDAALGELLAQPFVKQRFSAASRAAVQTQVKAVSHAFEAVMKKLPWFDASTRAKALEKLHQMAYLIGYPNHWKAYPWTVTPLHGKNVLSSRSYERLRDLRRIGKPVDRGRWEMTPPTVNAYYHPNKNQMVFPAGILQPPFFNSKASIAVNLGGMGMVVGHEMTHGFDDQGAQFDGYGNLRNWWSLVVKKRFGTRTMCVKKQYARFAPLPGVHLNGKLTAGENIADLGGVKLAFRAYRALRAHATEALVADGFTEDQQFFLSVAQIWCAKSSDAYKRMAVKVDPHSPPRFRVNGSLANTPEFARAFKCPKGTPMNPRHTCQVW